MKYRHNRYQLIRTASVMFFQLGFAFLIPQILKSFNEPEFYFTYFWPLKPEYLFPSTVSQLTGHPGALGTFMVFWGALASFAATPVLTFFYGKRWYCSWVCGCGGLAETLGDPFRQLSSKSTRSWKVERSIIYSVLVLVTATTIVLWVDATTHGAVFGSISGPMSRWYGFYIGALFSGVIGVGFYPILGSRVWCRFGCPMAAILGIFQRFFSRFRITTNGGSACRAELLYLLRNGHRRAGLRPTRGEYRAVLLCGMRDLFGRLSPRGIETGKRRHLEGPISGFGSTPESIRRGLGSSGTLWTA